MTSTRSPRKELSKPSLLPHWDGDIYSKYAAPFYDLVTSLTGWKAHLSSALENIEPCRLLDVGCGTGSLMRQAFERGFDVTGIDASSGMLERARELLGADGPESLLASATELPFRDDSFDTAIASGSLVHIPEIAQAASEMLRVVKSGGLIRIIDHAIPQERSLLTPLALLFSQCSGDIIHDYEHQFSGAGKLRSHQTLGRAGILQRYDFIVCKT